MAYSQNGVGLKRQHIMMLGIVLLASTTACDSSIRSGPTISNELMSAMYPQSFRPGDPEYLERDFEAGADFICDEIEIQYQRDICAGPEINWRW